MTEPKEPEEVADDELDPDIADGMPEEEPRNDVVTDDSAAPQSENDDDTEDDK
jgi:hypothetical protein